MNDIKNIRKKIISMILPITFENILQMTAGLITMAMIGRIDEVSISAIGLSSRIYNLIWALFKGVATGVTVIIAQSFGAKDFEKLRKSVKQAFITSIFFVLMFQIIILLNSKPLLMIFNPKDNLLSHANLYLRITTLSLPFMVIILLIAGIMQGMGNAKTPMYVTLSMNAFNIIFGYILIFGHFGFPKLGLIGAAISSVLSYFLASLIGLFILFKKTNIVKGLSLKPELDKQLTLNIYKLGLPSSFESVFWQVAAIILTRMVLKYGETSLAAYQVGLQAESISYMPAIGFGIAATSFIGQAVGAKDFKSSKIYLKEILKGSILITSFTTALLVFFPNKIMMMLTNRPEVIKIGALYLFIMGLVQIPQNTAMVFTGALRGAGFTQIPMYVAFVGLWGIRVPGVILISSFFKLPIVYIWIVMAFDLVIRFLLSMILYKYKKISNDKS
ncbi:Multidrug resistance protein NorM [Caloramator mitchellensis]|uniref:Probable multidrug resistance protein NorM n=1 Tax=Caloramator mitchellensis TaxID=908809 RepID=A0A0R3JVS5_CALMK|nr:MATE family efflux transporter [Caloramator mitchellensis]KRQ87689.1 Multidrug resistance protein NorM [Caloramator mitchellensis]